MDKRENILRTVRFECPETIPIQMSISNACWHTYPQDVLLDMIREHPLLFPDFESTSDPVQPQYAPFRIAGRDYIDSWGSVWRTVENGVTGSVISHALPTWKDFEFYTPPDPAKQYGWGPIDWDSQAGQIDKAGQNGQLKRGSLRHGHTFLTLVYIRGYEALLYDMVDGDKRLDQLLVMVKDFNLALVHKYIELGVEWMAYPEDLGMQHGPMLSPHLFRHYIKPVYQCLMEPAHEAGCIVHMHSDGDIRVLSEDLLDCGVDVLNLQDLVNDLEWIAGNLKGRVCIDLDVDRQQISRFGTPTDIDNLILREVRTLGDPQGGLMLIHGLMPGLPLENVRALMDAMEKYASYYT